MTETQERQRIDKWLWFARMARTRSLAVALVAGGRVRLNGARVDAPGKGVKIGDVLTLNLPQGVRVARILGLPHRRGPAPEAAQCWLDLTGTAGPEDNSPGRGVDEDNADSTTLEM
ncbi:RNA-binding S4 domain-containing protein [Camelimonas lactis]|uniref:Ribosome-associated heat shock protein Hsp15 n=1 Tax=Camelimonas lactis TaxID=659006 RepID=A0A4R2GUU8_9HYPH|nr:RNA-binding S4 domain-containing protein [Camelimonas lactis]TCO14579.1 ribosome-associated heat shock protein Hsp15 [Camelimonas lactis]